MKATALLHNILTVPADKVCSEVTDRGAILDDDAFQDLANVGSRPATVANDVRNYFTDYFNSVASLLNGKMSMPMYIRYTVY